MSLEKDITGVMKVFEQGPMPRSEADKQEGLMGKSTSPLPDDYKPESQLYKKTPIVKADWDCEVIPTERGGYGFTLIIYKNGEEVKRQAGFGSIGVAQAEARNYVLLEEFNIDSGGEE